jgi:putative oxidoreductase
MKKAEEIAYLLLRIVAGVMFFQAGAMGILGWFGGLPAPMSPTAPLLSQIGIGKLMELVGGIAIALGLFTRPVAFLLSGEMAVAYWQFHAPNGTWPIQNHGGEAVLYCFIFLFMAARGGGEYSLDAWRKRRKPA